MTCLRKWVIRTGKGKSLGKTLRHILRDIIWCFYSCLQYETDTVLSPFYLYSFTRPLYCINECTNCMLKAFSCKRAKGWRQTLGFIQNVKNDMNERNRIEQLFYCTRCNDLAQVWSKCTWVHNEPFIISSFFRNLVFWSIGFLLKSCLELKFKNWNGGRDFDAVFVWKLDMASKGISHAIFVVQTMLQYYDTSIYSELNATVPKEVFYWYDIRWRNGFSSG